MYPIQDFIDKAKIFHSDKYDYSKVSLTELTDLVTIICPVHGEFNMRAKYHIYQKRGCQKCGYAKNKDVTEKINSNNDDIFERLKKVHTKKYIYSDVRFNSIKDRVIIICPKHGDFIQVLENHLTGDECPSCVNDRKLLINKKVEIITPTYEESHISKDLYDFVKSLDGSAILEDRTTYPGLMFDITIPSKNLAIEYNGIYWHAINNEKTDRYKKPNHLKDKLIKAQEYDLRVLNIYEDEWLNSRLQVEQIIRNALNIIHNTIGARKCTVLKIDTKHSYWDSHVKPFFSKYHHQGLNYKPNGVAYCLVYDKQIMACAYFGSNVYHNKNDCELIRFATKADWKVPGSLSKLVKAFLKDNPQIDKIKSYCDARFFNGHGYKQAGFKQIDWISPGFDIIVNGQRKHRSCIIKNKLISKFDEQTLKSKTQMELAAQLGWYAVPDCGQLVFEYEQ